MKKLIFALLLLTSCTHNIDMQDSNIITEVKTVDEDYLYGINGTSVEGFRLISDSSYSMGDTIIITVHRKNK